MKLANFIEILFLFEACLFSNAIGENLPMIMITWNYGTAAAKGILINFNINLSQEK